MTFEQALTAIQGEFNETAIAAHWTASMEARDAFFNNLWTQFEEDILVMDPNWVALQERLNTICQNFGAVGQRIQEEFNTRIGEFRHAKCWKEKEKEVEKQQIWNGNRIFDERIEIEDEKEAWDRYFDGKKCIRQEENDEKKN